MVPTVMRVSSLPHTTSCPKPCNLYRAGAPSGSDKAGQGKSTCPCNHHGNKELFCLVSKKGSL